MIDDNLRVGLEIIFRDVLELSDSVDLNELQYGISESWDSLGFMEIVVNVESKFGVVFEPHDFQELHSFASFFIKVREKLEK